MKAIVKFSNINQVDVFLSLVCKLFPAVIFPMALNKNGVDSLPVTPANFASSKAFKIALLMTSSMKLSVNNLTFKYF